LEASHNSHDDNNDDDYDEEDEMGLGRRGEVDLGSMELQLKNMLNFQAR
jgi:hypothetical protein